MGSTILRQVTLGCIRKSAKQESENKPEGEPAGSMPPWLLLWGPVLISLKDGLESRR